MRRTPYLQVENEGCEKALYKLKIAKEMEQPKTFNQDVLPVGHSGERSYFRLCMILSPPINFGVDSCEDSYIEDWAVIEIDSSNVDASNHNHNGNVTDFDARIPFSKLTKNDLVVHFQVSE